MSEGLEAHSIKKSGIGLLRSRLREFLEDNRWEYFILSVIALNAIILGIETDKRLPATLLEILTTIDHIILMIFVVELSLRMFAYGAKFWTDPWSLFDLIIVGIALVPATDNLSVLRAFRVLRALRLISSVESMKTVVSGLLTALPGIGSITLLLLLICYVFAVMATGLFGDKFPELFGSLPASAYSLFQIMTLDGWSSEIVRPVMKEYPLAWVYFIIFILITSFAVLNLFIGIIVEALQSPAQKKNAEMEAVEDDKITALLKEVRALRQEVTELKK